MPNLLMFVVTGIILWIAYLCFDAYARHRYIKLEAKSELRAEKDQQQQDAAKAAEQEQQRQNRLAAEAEASSLPYPTPSLKPHGVSIFELKLGNTFPKYRYTDVSVRYADDVFKQLPPYSFFSLMYVNDSAVILYFDTNDDPVVVALLQNQKMIDMVRDWTEKNWTCHAQVSASGESIDLAFWDHE